MYISLLQIIASLKELESIHPFYGITFLACKQAKLPVGKDIEFPINAMEENFLKKYYKPNPQSTRFYRVYRLSDKENKWLRPDYASSGSQKSRTTTFRDAFIHEMNSDHWGWASDYVTFLAKLLHKQKRVPAFHLACWLYREREWPSDTIPAYLVAMFLKEFTITEEEQDAFFDTSIPDVEGSQLFSKSKVTWKDMRRYLGDPPDTVPEEGGTLALLGLTAIGPAKKVIFQPAERLNIITGDNGLGKTFLLECAWWVLSGQWAGLPAFPSGLLRHKEPSITYQLSGATTSTVISYDWQTQTWPYKKNQLVIPGLSVYARVDGSFAVWDPAKRLSDKVSQNRSLFLSALIDKVDAASKPLIFTPDQVWDGIEDKTTSKTRIFCNGLLRDWITWQNKPDKYPFETFKKVISRLSPRDLGPLQPGEPTRLPEDAREIPTLKYPYGEVPIVHAAAGIRRIVALAYLIVWAWEEHKAQSALTRKNPQKSMVILIDEVEAHLHPQWQRIILPSLMDIYEDLDKQLQIQFLIATHSPLVTASAEARFDKSKDKLFHLDFADKQDLKDNVVLEEVSFIRYGRVDSWLTSDIFDLKQARSVEAETTMEKAKQLQMEENPSKMDIKSISKDLQKCLSEDDPFWPRWIGFALKHDVHL